MKSALLRKVLLLSSLTNLARAFLLPRNNTNNDDDAVAGDFPSTQSTSGNTDCAASSTASSFQLSFVSYGNYTALPGQGDDDDGGLVPRQLVSMTLAAANAANGVLTVCAFPLGRLPAPAGNGSGGPASWVEDASWQACADRRDTDGKHRFTIATGAAFALAERRLSVNQTWFCHDDDDDGRLVAYTGVANGTLNMTCADGGELGGYHVENCTSADVSLPITLL
ncbi:uncharacterized protein F4807DRAFT_411768 [Annulohypoxylon truncatum]|uniref:uncharacterized protein n=1 Tax=Annulohypoxylon truncatum TaxID=327061 RepID=UPI0020077883|nr:uncharacterized protein F4807DRAFT_411768 [Annulohypoxylon truncatum]KAI1212860.1 hypothetical protein F4807DRAFT_411768 [Annulohypoxylon truncatum]